MSIKIHSFQTHSDLRDLESSLSSKDNQDVMRFLYPFRNDKIGKTLQQVIRKFTKNYNTPMEFFDKKKFETFMEFFTRKLNVEKDHEIRSTLKEFSMVLPAESDIESLGSMSDTSSILRLKKPAAEVEQELMELGIDASTMDFVNMKLQKAYYHHVHVPVTGTIEKLLPIDRKDPMFGDNSLWVVYINTEKHGHVVLLLVGELSIQDFKFDKKEGDAVEIFDELGRFDWGSQVVMLYEKGMFPGNILLQSGQTYFVGEGVFATQDLQSHFEPTPDALGGGTAVVTPAGQDQLRRNLEPTRLIKKFGELDGI